MLISRTFKRNILIHYYNSTFFRRKHEWICPEGFDTGIKVYNPVTKDKSPLIVPNKHYVKWYICGPTVYDTAHIGHASCYVRLDIIRRILENFFGLRPVIALGITDVDDKIIIRSQSTNEDFRSLAKRYELEFLSQLNELNILPPSFTTRVTDHIPDIISFVTKIIETGKGYVARDGSVYFDSSSRPYGKLVQFPPEADEVKFPDQRRPSDFALWKGVKSDEPYWETPWGKGRPGWHIECSAMASKLFGSQLDLHSGGIDLIFPHHENEESQSCCYHGNDQWVNYWIHAGNLHVGNVKMSKSLKNFISVQDYLQNYTTDQLRMMCFISHYRSGIDYNDASLSHSTSLCMKVDNFLANADNYMKGTWTSGNVSESVLLELLSSTSRDIKEYLADDFNTPKCFQSLMNLISISTKMLSDSSTSTESRSSGAIAAVANYISHVFQSFGFRLDNATIASDSKDYVSKEVLDAAVRFRSNVRETAVAVKEKDAKKNLFRACDKFRNELHDIGVDVKDFTGTSSWSYCNKR